MRMHYALSFISINSACFSFRFLVQLALFYVGEEEDEDDDINNSSVVRKRRNIRSVNMKKPTGNKCAHCFLHFYVIN